MPGVLGATWVGRRRIFRVTDLLVYIGARRERALAGTRENNGLDLIVCLEF